MVALICSADVVIVLCADVTCWLAECSEELSAGGPLCNVTVLLTAYGASTVDPLWLAAVCDDFRPTTAAIRLSLRADRVYVMFGKKISSVSSWDCFIDCQGSEAAFLLGDPGSSGTYL